MKSFEQAFNALLERELRAANGRRLEMLQRDLTGTKQMLEIAVWPVRKSLDGIELEKELVGRSGVRVFIDAFEEPTRLGLESEGFVTHAEKITRDRFSFEKARVRWIASYGIYYIPFSRDELESKPDECRGSYAELIGAFSASGCNPYEELTLYEREVLRYARRLFRPIRIADAQYCLHVNRNRCGEVMRGLMTKGLISPCGEGLRRICAYKLEEASYRYLL